jgi:hypothetical protein
VRDATDVRRRVGPKRSGLVTIGIIVLLAACGGSGGRTEAATEPDERSPTDTAPEVPEEDAATVLDGTWRTDALTVGDQKRTLRKHGLAEWVDRYARLAPISGPTSMVLDIHDGKWDLYGKPKGGTQEEIDYDADVSVAGDTVTASHEGDSNTYRWSITGDVLRITWLETTYEPYKGIPEEVFQTALYMTKEFVRQN